MTKHAVTEDAVVLAYWEQIGHFSAPYRHALGRDDAHMEGLLGLLVAIRSYRESYTDFQTYMKQCTIKQLELAKNNYQSKYRVESRMSLDQNIAESTATYKDTLPARSDAAEDCCMLHEFTASLSDGLRPVFWWRYFGYPDHEIAVRLAISDQAFSERLDELQSAWFNYCGNTT